MAARQIIGTLRRLTRAAQKRMEKERKAEQFLLEADKRARDRKEEIYAKREPEPIGDLIIEEIIEQAKRIASRGAYTTERNLCAMRNDTEVKQLVVTKLEELGFAAEISCGHGHGGYTGDPEKGWQSNVINCDGTSYESCWPELHISWGKDSKNWKEKSTRRD